MVVVYLPACHAYHILPGHRKQPVPELLTQLVIDVVEKQQRPILARDYRLVYLDDRQMAA